MISSQSIVCVILGIGLAAGLARAGDPPASDAQTKHQPAATPKDEPTATPKDGAAATPAEPKKPEMPKRAPGLHTATAVKRQLMAYERLQNQMTEELSLSDDQKSKVATIFDTYRTDIQDPTVNPSIYRGPDDEEPLRVSTKEHMKRKADAKGKKNPGPVPPPVGSRARATVFDGNTQLIEDLSNELEFEQRKKFEPMAARWDLLLPATGMRDGPMARVLRAVKDPQLDISDDQRADFLKRIGKKMVENREARLANANLQPVADELRSDILKELTPRQQEHFTATLKTLDAYAAVEAEEEARQAEAAKQKEIATGKPSQASDK